MCRKCGAKKNIIFRIKDKKRDKKKYTNDSELIKPQQYEINWKVKFTNFTKNINLKI